MTLASLKAKTEAVHPTRPDLILKAGLSHRSGLNDSPGVALLTG